MSQPTPRQVLYALVAAGFVVIVAVLTIGAAASGVTPTWWSATMAFAIAGAAAWIGPNWRSTGSVLLVAIGLFVIWMIGTLAVLA